MIQDILPYKYDNHYVNIHPDSDAYLIFTSDGSILLKKMGNEISYPKLHDLVCKDINTTYLFSLSDEKFFFSEDGDAVEYLCKKGYSFCRLPELRKSRPRHLGFAGATAYQLCGWYRANRYCGHCGGITLQDAKERMLFCDKCGSVIYPKICPAVIVAVMNGDKILLTKGAGNIKKHYALIAGFAEVGETIEDTVRREVMEETGIKVKNIRFYKSQPWSFSDTLLFGFYCELDGSDKITIQREELSVAEWVSREKVPDDDDKISLTYEMMEKFKNSEQI